jgi:hypothetical protein
MGSARYWNQDVDLSLRLTGTLNVDLRELGLKLQRSRHDIGHTDNTQNVLNIQPVYPLKLFPARSYRRLRKLPVLISATPSLA